MNKNKNTMYYQGKKLSKEGCRWIIAFLRWQDQETKKYSDQIEQMIEAGNEDHELMNELQAKIEYIYSLKPNPKPDWFEETKQTEGR